MKKIIIAMLLLVVLPMVFAGTVTRSISPSTVKPGQTVTITLTIDAVSGDKAYTLQETSPITIQGLGTFVYETGAIDQIQLSDTIKEYQVIPQSEGTFTFSGIYRFNGEAPDMTIAGMTDLVVSSAECSVQTDCGIDTECMDYACEQGTCNTYILNEGLSCSENVGPGVCENGVCIPVECVIDDECLEDTECMDYSCIGNECTSSPINEGNACTINQVDGTCQEGTCMEVLGCVSPDDCVLAGGECKIADCVGNECTYTNVADGTSCENGGECKTGVCTSPKPTTDYSMLFIIGGAFVGLLVLMKVISN